jgi:hypothetical protein
MLGLRPAVYGCRLTQSLMVAVAVGWYQLLRNAKCEVEMVFTSALFNAPSGCVRNPTQHSPKQTVRTPAQWKHRGSCVM